MKFTLEIDCDNASFGGIGPIGEVRRILIDLTRDMQYLEGTGEAGRQAPIRLRDYNGNTVGSAVFNHESDNA